MASATAARSLLTSAERRSELEADTYKALAHLRPPERSWLLWLECNAGLSEAVRNDFLRPLAADFTAPVRAKVEPWDVVTWQPSASELEGVLREEQTAYLSGRAVEAAPPAGRTAAQLWLAPNVGEGLVNSLFDNHALYFPQLPWSRSAAQCSDCRTLDARIAPTASFRTVDFFPCDGPPSVLKIHSTEDSNMGPGRVLTRFGYWAKRSLLMGRVFKVDREMEGAPIERIDALHSLHLSQVLAEIARKPDSGIAFQSECAAAMDSHGRGYVVRWPLPHPPVNDESVLIPYLSVLGNLKQCRLNLLSSLSRSAGIEPSQMAIELGRRYLFAWHYLLFQHRLILLMPHAQNALFELLPGNRIGRVVLKDMRDMELWPIYRQLSGKSTRLIAADRHYIRYQMTVHPFYYDMEWRTPPEARAAAGVFNYSFQMLRNYVLRGFELALREHDGSEAGKVLTAFTDMIEGLTESGAKLPSAHAPSGRETAVKSLQRLRRAWRRLRRQWVELALSSD